MKNTDTAPAISAESLRSNPPVNMSLEEAAIYVGVSKRKLWGEIKSRHLKAAQVGRRLILTRVELDRYLSVSMAAA